MSKNFWEKLPRPIFVLAPMADVTDQAFRRIIAKYGRPDVTWTEFVSADGLCSPGRSVLLHDLKFTDEERPIVAQLFTGKPEKMEEAAKLVQELGFDGIDINMGCPDRGVEKQGAGAALIRDVQKAKEIIRAVRRGAPNLPVSVKTRIGYNKDELQDWIGAILGEELAVLTIHARTRKEMSDVPAQWEKIKEAVELRSTMGKTTLIFGNGDVKNIEEARERVKQTGADGVMLGRAIFGNPWLFVRSANNPELVEGCIPTIEEKLRVMIEHTKPFEELLGEIKNFAIMKKHYKAYVNGFDGAKELRLALMDTEKSDQVEKVVKNFLKNSSF